MKLIPDKPRIYLSHSIRGNGSRPIEENCERAIKVGHKIIKCFPEIDLFVPGEHDLALQLLWKAGKVKEEDILWADLEILRHSNNWCWWYTCPSRGCQIEADEAEKIGLVDDQYENIIYTDLTKSSYADIRRIFNPIVSTAIERFRNENNSRLS